MNTPAPLPPQPNSFTPSTSVVSGLAIGIPAATLIAWILDANGIKMPPQVEAAMGTLIGSAIAYFGNGGKAIHTSR